jgi:ribosomal-protein-alanine N-acetyltransferase
MTLADIPQVMEIERLSFALPWSENSFREELSDNDKAHFFVATSAERVVGAAGYWQIEDECHISTVATHPDWRRRGIGELLLKTMLSEARTWGAALAVLEVRVSNEAAIQLYKKYRFEISRVRRNYYRDNDEDALEMLAQLTEATGGR